MVFEQVMSPDGLGERFCGFLAEKPKYLVCGDCLQSPIHILTIIFILVGFYVVRVSDLTANKTIINVIDFAPAGAAFIVGGRLDVSPTRFDLNLLIKYSPTLRLELEVPRGTGSLPLMDFVPTGTVIEFWGYNKTPTRLDLLSKYKSSLTFSSWRERERGYQTSLSFRSLFKCGLEPLQSFYDVGLILDKNRPHVTQITWGT
eukprot:TRINITY_DN1051_c0_g1_i9.p1 TRINITY_DN1051_c0_g1~~TRINITY_DN1051_c0_g1_i9.p1  ORF type:complete len:202 (-),score=21.63 TRINITY_DN1051_c0_g1_i9:289-894(-)